MNGIHEVTGSIPVWSTNLRSRMQAEVAHRSGVAAKVGLTVIPRELRLASQAKIGGYAGAGTLRPGGAARQNALCEAQDAPYVHFFELGRVHAEAIGNRRRALDAPHEGLGLSLLSTRHRRSDGPRWRGPLEASADGDQFRGGS